MLSARLKSFGIEHRNAPVRAPHCNPVERTNRTIKTMISQYVDKDHREWDRNIPAFQFAFNTAIHDATGYTPAYINYGRELAPPTPIPEPRTDEEEDPDILHQHLEDAYKVVRINLARAFQKQEKHYNLQRREWRPKIGEHV